MSQSNFNVSEPDSEVCRIEALSRLFVELKQQSDALSTLWGLCKAWVDGRSRLDGRVMSAHPAVEVLARKSYRTHLWALDPEIAGWINDFAENSHTIQAALAQGLNAGPDSMAVTARFMAAGKPLSLAIRDITGQMSRLSESTSPHQSPTQN